MNRPPFLNELLRVEPGGEPSNGRHGDSFEVDRVGQIHSMMQIPGFLEILTSCFLRSNEVGFLLVGKQAR